MYETPREQFYAMHGDYVNTPHRTHLFITGAEADPSRGGMLTPPPTDEWELAQMVRTYWELKLERLQSDFQVCKKACTGHACFEFPRHVRTTEDRIEYLEKLRMQVKKAKRKLKAALEEEDELEPEHRKAARDQSDEMEEDEKLRRRIDKIRI